MNTSGYIQVIEDLAKTLEPERRYQRLLDAIQQEIPCDAIALLKLRDQHLEPLAFKGLRREMLGRRFLLEQHPRLASILASRTAVRFESDSELPDPYDGLVEAEDGVLHVHDCMGMSIYINEQPWGVVTLDAMRPGQFGDVDPMHQQVVMALTRAVITAAQRIALLEQQLSHGHEVTAELSREQGPSDIIGKSAPIRALLQEIDTVARAPLAVLIQGETGVGKEIVARHLHQKSDRREQPFVHINCAALPETLAEAELFGHTKGAFTGAATARSGRFELADGGTLLLDEVGELPLSIQAKLLRALQEGEIQRMGSDDTVKVDVRILAATNRDLKAEVKAGRFRADLFHRLSVFPIPIPPLRDRGRDILLLAEHFLERDQQRLNIRKLILSEPARAALMDYPWHGNVRELEHVLSRAALKASRMQGAKGVVAIEVVNLGLDADMGHQPVDSKAQVVAKEGLSLQQSLDQHRRQLIRQALAKHGYNIAAAARELQVDRSNLQRLIKRLGIESDLRP